MNLEKYSSKMQGVLSRAQTLALSKYHQQLSPLHLLSEMLADEDGFTADLINFAGGSSDVVKKEVEKALNKLPQVEGGSSLSLSPELAKVFVQAEKIALEAGDSFVTAERVLEAIVKEKSSSAESLRLAGINEKSLKEAINKLRQGKKADSASAEESYKSLEKYAIDFTALAKNGKLDPVIGRDEEIRRVVQILSRRTKNNPVLIGEPGVGKTAIIEGLAQRIISGDVPESLKNRRLFSLDMGALIAGAKYRGEFEERLKAVLKEIEKANSGGDGEEIILFIDELHLLIGAGKTDGAMDASNLLKPALARGTLHCVGATTLDEYRKYIEGDKALARRFQTVYTNEPTVEDTIAILRGIKEKYEVHHGIKIQDSALVAAASLSNRYITDRFLPDKAIDLIDEAAAKLKMEVDSKPLSLDQLDRKIIKLKIEAEALKKENDKSSIERLKTLLLELEKLEKESFELTTKWQAEKKRLNKINDLKEKLDTAKGDFANAQRRGDFAKASEINYGLIPNLQKQLAEVEGSKEQKLVKETVTEEDITAIVSKITGIPLEKMMTGEKEKLIKMESYLRKKVVGQEKALFAVANTVRRSRAGLSDQNRPIGSFLFLGPTGVGKTELTKALANFIFDDANALVRIDMSEYMEKHSVSKLIGAPPGYVGYEQGGSLTEAVRRRPYQVVLFDEVEKAHPDVFNILLQVLDEGRLTDSQGKHVDFKNTIIILTSNLGASHLANLDEGESLDVVEAKVMQEVRLTFRPEFINRIDEIIIFNRLSRDAMAGIVDIQFARLQERLKVQNIEILLDKSAHKYLSDKGYDPIYGARPLKRVIQRELENLLADKILKGEIKEGDSIKVKEKGGELVV
jgi:ATP-dependent Clp protease ATP-binding subunit ClpB